jgi:hypothetical protein
MSRFPSLTESLSPEPMHSTFAQVTDGIAAEELKKKNFLNRQLVKLRDYGKVCAFCSFLS